MAADVIADATHMITGPSAHIPSVVDDDVVVGYRAERGSGSDLVLGGGSRLRRGTVLYRGSVIGVRLTTGHNVVIREDCRLGDDVSVWSNTVVDYGCRIGNGVKIHSNCYVSQFTVIEDDAFLAPGVSLANDLYPGVEGSAELMRGPHIGAGAQLGVNVTVLPYVHIGSGAVIGAGSVVVRDIPPGVIALGNPAVPVRPVPDPEQARERLLRAAVGNQEPG